MTHTPPLGFGDTLKNGKHVGDVDLLLTVRQRVMPKFHLFGHVHGAYGISTDNTTTFINAAFAASKQTPSNKTAIIFDTPI